MSDPQDRETAPEVAPNRPGEAKDRVRLPWEDEGTPAPPSTHRASTLVLWRKYLTVALLVVSCFILVPIAIGHIAYPNRSAQPSTAMPSNGETAQNAVPSAPPSPPTKRISTHDASRRAEVVSTQAELDALRADLSDLGGRLRAFEQQHAEMLDNDLGRRLAADPTAIEVFASLAERERMDARSVESMRRTVMVLAEPVEAAVDDVNSVLEIDDEFERQVDEIRKRVDRELQSLGADQRVLQLLSRDATQRDPAGLSLAEAIEAHRTSQLRKRNDAVATEVKKQREAFVTREVEAQVAVEKLQSDKRLAEVEQERLRTQADVARTRADNARIQDAIEAAKKKAELVGRFERERAQVMSTLVPFISQGRKQIVDGEWRMTEEDQPLSLSGLQAVDALNDDQMGAQRLFHVAGGMQNDRPNGAFGSYIGGHIHDNRIPLALRAQRYLREYGELMVEQGMLKP